MLFLLKDVSFAQGPIIRSVYSVNFVVLDSVQHITVRFTAENIKLLCLYQT